MFENDCSLHEKCHEVVDTGETGCKILKIINSIDASAATLVDDMNHHSRMLKANLDSTLQPNSNTHSKKDADIKILLIFAGLFFFLLLLCLFYFCLRRRKEKNDPHAVPLEPNDRLPNYDMKVEVRVPKPIPPFSDESDPNNTVYLTNFLETKVLFEDSIERRESTPPPRFIDIQGQWRDITRDYILFVEGNKCSILDPKDATPPAYIYETQTECYMNIGGDTWVLEKAADTATWREQKTNERIEWDRNYIMNKRDPLRSKSRHAT